MYSVMCVILGYIIVCHLWLVLNKAPVAIGNEHSHSNYRTFIFPTQNSLFFLVAHLSDQHNDFPCI